MPKHELPPADLDATAQILIAEHQRLSDLYLYNTDMGERRTSMYISVISLGAAGLIGLAQLVDSTILYWPATVLLVGMLVLGLLTFHRLIERRMRGVENLRAINRIHRYFVEKQPEVAQYFYWAPCDDLPSFRGKGGAFAGLRDIVALLNSLFGGFLGGEILAAIWQGLPLWASLLLGGALTLALWVLHQRYEDSQLKRAEERALARDVHFPRAAFENKAKRE
ncbi:MAG: hypothetical protein AB1894_03865 [Chloroflexota bacterium]